MAHKTARQDALSRSPCFNTRFAGYEGSSAVKHFESLEATLGTDNSVWLNTAPSKTRGPVTLERIHHNRQSTPESPCQAAEDSCCSWCFMAASELQTETFHHWNCHWFGSPNCYGKSTLRKSSDSKTRCIRHIPKNKKCHKSCHVLPRILKVQLLGPRNMSKSSW